MPQVTVYIREDDINAWKAIQQKAELVHWAIEQHQKKHGLVGTAYGVAVNDIINKVTGEVDNGPVPTLEVNPSRQTSVEPAGLDVPVFKHTPEQEATIAKYFPEPRVTPPEDAA